MPTKTERPVRDGEFINRKANGDRSVEQVTIEAAALATAMNAGTVLAKRTSDGKWARFAVGGADGLGTAAALVHDNLEISAADKRAVIVARDCTVNGNKLTWPAGITGPQTAAAIAQLAQQGIIVRA